MPSARIKENEDYTLEFNLLSTTEYSLPSFQGVSNMALEEPQGTLETLYMKL